MNIDNLQKRIIFLSAIVAIVKIVGWIAFGWLGVSAILHIGEFGLKHLIDAIWLGGL